MLSRFWRTAIVLVIIVAAIVLAIIGLIQNIPAMAIVALVLAALAVVGYNYLVMNPARLENAKKSAREYCEAGQIIDPNLHEQLCSRLARAPQDSEAADLHHRLIELREKGEKQADTAGEA
jgi:flagellar biosynthesis component FlhA